MLLEGFLHMVATRPDVRLPSAASQLQGSTLLLYLKAAALWLQTELNVTVHVVSPTTQKILPPFRDVIAQAFKWGTPQPKREPYTHQMLKTFYQQVHNLVQKNPLICSPCLWQYLTGCTWACLQAVAVTNTVKRLHVIMKSPEFHWMRPLANMLADPPPSS